MQMSGEDLPQGNRMGIDSGCWSFTLDQHPPLRCVANSSFCRRITCSRRGGNNVVSIWTEFARARCAILRCLAGDGVDCFAVRSHEFCLGSDA
jgi:hypothetical protein